MKDKRDINVLNDIIKRYGYDDVIHYITENFENSFDDNIEDYTDIMDRDDYEKKVLNYIHKNLFIKGNVDFITDQ